MDPIKIRSAQFVDSYFPLTDGVVQTVHNYASIMNRDSFSCVIAPSAKEPYDDGVFDYKVIRTKTANAFVQEYTIPRPRSDKALREFLDGEKIDIFHAHSPFFEGRFAAYYAKSHNIPCVVTFHSKYYDDALHVTGSKFLAKRLVGLIVGLYNRVDSVWACSNGTANTLKEYGYKGDVFVMDNGSSLNIPAEERPALKLSADEKYSFPKDKKVLVFVGHLIWHKNLKLILDTFRLLCNVSDEYVLMIVGEGYDGEEIKSYADSLSFPDGAVRFTGKISDRDTLAGIYLNSSLLFFPSVYDNSPLVVREAASLGLPSLLTAGSNAAEAVKKDVSGFTAAEDSGAMFEEIKKIFASQNLYAAVCENAEKMIPKTWEEIVRRVREKYAEVIDEYNFKNKK